jgi:hypothetical protein
MTYRHQARRSYLESYVPMDRPPWSVVNRERDDRFSRLRVGMAAVSVERIAAVAAD